MAREPKPKAAPAPLTVPQAYPLPPRVVRRVPFTPDLFDEMCDLLAGGASIVELGLIERFPTPGVFYGWLHNEAFVTAYHEARGQGLADTYARAREDQQHVIAAEGRYIADTDPDPQRAKNRMEARRWEAAKLSPKVYGDKTQVDLSGAIKHEQPAVAEIAEAVRKLADKL